MCSSLRVKEVTTTSLSAASRKKSKGSGLHALLVLDILVFAGTRLHHVVGIALIPHKMNKQKKTKQKAK